MKKILVGLFAVALLVACGKNVEDRNVKELFSAFLNENSTIIGFGSAEINSILAKTDYSNQPLVGAFLNQPVHSLNSSLNLDNPLYYAVEGPLVNDNPTAVYIFAEVKNLDSLRYNLEQNGFEVQKDKDFEYVNDHEMHLGMTDKFAIIVVKHGETETKKLIADAIQRTKGDLAEGPIEDMLSDEGDVVFGMNVENLYATSNTDLKNLDKDKQKELEAMLKGSFVQNSIKFEDGAAIFESRNYFSDDLKAKMFFNTNANAPIVAKLGQGKPTFGLSVNLDMKKMQHFMDDYSPETMEMMSDKLGAPFKLAMMTAGNDLASIFNGQFGVVMMGQPDMMEGMTPDFNFYLGLGDKGQKIGEMAKSLIGEQFASVNLSSDGLAASTSMEFVPSNSGKLNLPMGCENFGQKSISAFINLEDVDMSSFELEGEAKLLTLVKYATFEYDENGGRLTIKAKKGKENMLKQAVELLIKEVEGNMAGLDL